MAIFKIVLQIIAFLIANRAAIMEAINGLQQLFPAGAGAQKAEALQRIVGTALDIGDGLDKAWYAVKPIVDNIVAEVKGKTA